MGVSKTILAGAFTIEPAEDELADALSVAMGIESQESMELGFESLESIDPPTFLDVRRLVCEIGDEPLPPLFAMAMEFPTGPMWMIRGVDVVALIPIKRKYIKNSRKLLSPLVKWAETLAPSAAAAVVSAAFEGFTLGDPDSGTHFIVELPLDGITVDRPDGMDMDEWLDSLTDIAQRELESLDPDNEIILFDSTIDETAIIVGHVAVESEEDEESLQEFVKRAFLVAFSGFTPTDDVRTNLSVELEVGCMYSSYADFMDDSI